MSNWKADKDLGPWAFIKQEDKWGYLNNPRWLNTPRKFVHGGPDDYSGREDEEPQIYTPHEAKYPNGTIVKHHQCGHWHSREGGYTEMPVPPLQPCLDMLVSNDYSMYTVSGGGGAPGPDFGHTVFTMGLYYDAAHLNLVPGTFVDVFAMSENDHYFNRTSLSPSLIPVGTTSIYFFAHVIGPIFGDVWWGGPGPSQVYGTEKYFHAYRAENPTGVSGVMGVAYDCFFRGIYYADLGYSASNIGLYNLTGGSYVLIPGTLTYGPTWDINLDPSLFTVASWPPGVDIYVGVQLSLTPGRIYFPYVTIAETPNHAQWLGSFDDVNCWEVILDTDSEWISVNYRCGVMPLPTLNFTALPTPITIGDPVTLTWSSDGYYVTFNEGIGQVAANGSMVVYPTVTTVYTATATGPGGNTVVNKTVVVNTLTTVAPTTMGTTVVPTTLAPTTLSPTTAPPSVGAAWGYWRLEETTGLRSDATGNAHHGAVTETGTGVVGYAAAKLGNGATFLRGNGSAYLNISGYPDVESNNHFFFSGWVKVASGGSNTYGLLVDGDVQIYLNVDGANLEIEVFAGDRYVYYTGISFDVLHFISVYFNGTGVYVEVDNSPVASDAGNTNISTFAYLYIGQTDTYTGLVTVDEFGIWLGSEADATIANRADLWNGGSGYSPY